MSSRYDATVEDGLRKPLLHNGSWYRMGSRQSSIMGLTAQIIRESISIFFCVFIVALGPIQFGFTDVLPRSSHIILGILSVVGLVMLVIGFSLGLGAIPWVIMSEILPVNIESLAGSVATLANWMTAWLVTMTANLLLTWSSGGTFTVYAIISAFTVAFVTLWVPKTKGRTLEEIQSSF